MLSEEVIIEQKVWKNFAQTLTLKAVELVSELENEVVGDELTAILARRKLANGRQINTIFVGDPADETTAVSDLVVVSGDGKRWIADGSNGYNPYIFGAVGDGITDDRAAIAKLDALGGDSNFLTGTFLIGTDITLSSHIVLPEGAILRPAGGAKITIKNFSGNLSQHFDLSFGGEVELVGAAASKGLHPEWWGASGGGIEDDLSFIQAAIDNANAIGGAKVKLGNADYYITGSLFLKNSVTIEGVGWRYGGEPGTKILCAPDITPFTTGIAENDVSTMVTAVTLSNFAVFADATSTQGIGFHASGFRYQNVVERVAFNQFPEAGIKMVNNWESEWRSVFCRGKDGGGTKCVWIHDGNNNVKWYGGYANVGDYGFLIDADSENNQNIIIQGCLLESNLLAAIYARSGHTIKARDNYIEGNPGRGIRAGDIDATYRVHKMISEGNRFHNNNGSDLEQDNPEILFSSKDDYIFHSINAAPPRISAANNNNPSTFTVIDPVYVPLGTNPPILYSREREMLIISEGRVKLSQQSFAPANQKEGDLGYSDGGAGGLDSANGKGVYIHDGTEWFFLGGSRLANSYEVFNATIRRSFNANSSLTPADAGVVASGDATTDAVINNNRIRIAELEVDFDALSDVVATILKDLETRKILTLTGL